MGFSISSSGLCSGLYLEITLREWEPVSTQGVCCCIIPLQLSRSSSPTLLSAVSRSFDSKTRHLVASGYVQILSKDSVTVAVDAVVYYRVYNATVSSNGPTRGSTGPSL